MWKNVKEVFTGIGGCLIAIVILAAIGLFISLFIHGGAWVSVKVGPWLSWISRLLFIATILILLPLAFFTRTRSLSGNGMIFISYIFELTVWIWGFLFTYILWGKFAVFIGLFLLGIGVVPIGIIALLFNGMWLALGEIIFLTLLAFGTRLFGLYIIEKSTPKDYINLQN